MLTDGPAFMALLKDGNFAAAKQLGPDAYEALQIAAGLFLQMLMDDLSLCLLFLSALLFEKSQPRRTRIPLLW